jgi:hypothetical protein
VDPELFVRCTDQELKVMDPDMASDPELDFSLYENQPNNLFYYYDIKHDFLCGKSTGMI